MVPPGAPLNKTNCFYWASKLLWHVHPLASKAPQQLERNCYVARFGHPLKTLKSPAAALNRKPLRSSLRRRPACFAMVPPEAPQAVSIGLRNCYVARFGHPLKASKAPQQLSKAFEPQNPPQQLAKASRLLCHGSSRGPTSCLYWASKLLRGAFWAPLRSLKSPAAAFEGLWTAKPSAAACEGVPPALPWYLPRPHKLFLLGFETATWHVLRTR